MRSLSIGMLGIVSVWVFTSGCSAAGDDPQSGSASGDEPTLVHHATSEESVGSTSEALSSISFTRTCGPWFIDFYSDGSIFAGARDCRRKNGSTNTSWSYWGRGFCNGDLSNCNGRLQCGGPC